MLDCPKKLSYSIRHVWVDRSTEKKGYVTIGLTHCFVEEQPEFLSLDLPMVGDQLDIEGEGIFFHIDTGLLAIPVPLTGHVKEVNREVIDRPELVHVDPYRNWLLKIEFDDPAEFDLLISADRYNHYVDTL